MVICTYSVIIQSQKTLESFSQYQQLFADAVKSNKIGICKWIESGVTVDTALPELASLTDDKQEWRAIIVRYADNDCMADFEATPRNPYDFAVNQNKAEWEGESPIPLVRLTQMLGGVPPVEVKFRTEVIKEEYKAPRTVYVPVEDEQREQAYRSLIRKYRFDGKLPSSILIVTVRDSSYQEEGRLDREWTPHKESESSEFWKRNHFPSICRFMVYDFRAQGPIQKEADNFGFWYAVMMLSVNEWDSSTIQAYRLYSLRTVIDRPAMSLAFQELADRLRDAKCCIERSIRQDVENEVCEEETLPEYRIEVPVSFNRPKMDECLPMTRPFKLFSSGVATDVAMWNQQRRRAEEALEKSVKSAGRALDQTADKMRGSGTFMEDAVTPLNKYQEEDIRQELNGFYHAIVELQGKLPNENIGRDETLQASAASVRSYLLGRVDKGAALVGIVLAVILLGLSALPAIIACAMDRSGSAPAIAALVGVGTLCALLAAAAVLLFQKMKLDSLIRKYNRQLKKAFIHLTEQAGDYSTYMSGIGSYQRGSSYLDISTRKKGLSGAEHNQKYRHIMAINALLGRLRKWSKAYRLDVDYTSPRPDARVDVDVTVAPADNKVYAFDTQTLYPVAINNSGMEMESPYPFASRLEIVREELYDDE